MTVHDYHEHGQRAFNRQGENKDIQIRRKTVDQSHAQIHQKAGNNDRRRNSEGQSTDTNYCI